MTHRLSPIWKRRPAGRYRLLRDDLHNAIVRGQWLKPGTHVDLAGAFKPTMREIDGETVARARVFVDTREGAMAEAGDLIQARDEGKFDFANSRAISSISAGAP